MAPDNSVLRTFDGIIDEARLSNTAYSADWVAAQYASTTNAFVSFGTEETAPAIGGVTTNNTDTDGDFLSASIVSGPSNAAAFTFNVDGTFTYTPDLDFFGTDSFTYKVNDRTSDSNTATVTITVNPVNDAAAISGDISYTGNEGDVVADDLDATDVDGLTDTTYFTISAQGSSGTAVIDAETGAWTFTPTDPNWFGSDAFTVTVTDDLGGTTTQVVSITLANVGDTAVITGDNTGR